MLNKLQIPKSQLPSFISCLSLVSKSRHMYVGGGYRGTCTVIRAKGYSSEPEFRTSDLPLLQPECCSRTPPSSPTNHFAVADYNTNSPPSKARYKSRRAFHCTSLDVRCSPSSIPSRNDGLPPLHVLGSSHRPNKLLLHNGMIYFERLELGVS